jgi:multidrug efflux pump subunit AcrA (membrane-fusion protein)
MTLKSPISGTVLTLQEDSILGENFNKGDTIAVIGNLNRVKVKIQLPEEERAFVEVGQSVNARFRAVPDSKFKGTVSYIAPVTSETGEETNKRRIWEITLILQNPNNVLRPGMTGFAKIETGEFRSLLVLAWDEIYKSFRLDRYIDRNPFAKVSSSENL